MMVSEMVSWSFYKSDSILHCTWYKMHCFCTGEGFCPTNLQKLGLAFGHKYEFFEVWSRPHQSYIVNECPITILSDGGLQRLHSSDDKIVDDCSWFIGMMSREEINSILNAERDSGVFLVRDSTSIKGDFVLSVK